MDFLKELVADVREVCITKNVKSLYLLNEFNGKDKIYDINDIDFVVIIEDEINKILFLKTISASIQKIIIDYDIFVSITPIHSTEYMKNSSMFIENVTRSTKIL